MNAKGTVHKFGDNVDTDVIIPARYLNTASHKELAAHCMEDIDAEFVNKVHEGDIMVAEKNFGCGSSSIITLFTFTLFSAFPEFRGDADEELEVDAGHRTRQHREIVLVEQVIDGKFQLYIQRFERQHFLQ